MNDTKGLLASKTVWAALIAGGAAIASLFHVDFNMADQAATLDAVWNIISAAGALGAIWGRITATATIGSK